MKKKKRISLVKIFVLLVLASIFFYCTYQCYMIWKDYHDSEKAYLDIRNLYTKEKEETSENEETSCPVTLKEIDWDGLKQENPDVIGWIEIPGTVVDYPIMQSELEADYYLYRNPAKERYSAGSIFMETLNKNDFTDNNTIIYGHNMKNGSMFSCLKKYLDPEFEKEHQYVIIYTPEKNLICHVMHAFVTTVDSMAYEIWFENITYEDWLTSMKKISVKEITKDFDLNKSTITLSTCHGSHGTKNRMILQLQEI